MRLIDADAEREWLKKGYCEECTRKGNYGIFGAACTPCWVKDAIEEFDNAPTIEAEPVRRGRWNYRHEDDWCYCTACGTDAEGTDGECLETEYCPHCGARMDGGADD